VKPIGARNVSVLCELGTKSVSEQLNMQCWLPSIYAVMCTEKCFNIFIQVFCILTLYLKLCEVHLNKSQWIKQH